MEGRVSLRLIVGAWSEHGERKQVETGRQAPADKAADARNKIKTYMSIQARLKEDKFLKLSRPKEVMF
ncbi:MAG: hypothetical protein A2X93_05400 [Deltaproteobacteria bacterium GWC2_56_8]|nr:MAG: hypothetical protein A2X99_01735 [Deltaproteobacteria bacterium GWB2_55_19]OGP35015.1 MAG: hypothetical protein A2X93_05400 [Deltaproteobacteria bacterium GWC2_56_8]